MKGNPSEAVQSRFWGCHMYFARIWHGWLAGWPAGWLVGWLAGWLTGWLVGWLAGWPTWRISDFWLWNLLKTQKNLRFFCLFDCLKSIFSGWPFQKHKKTEGFFVFLTCFWKSIKNTKKTLCFFVFLTFLGISDETLALGLIRRQDRYQNSQKSQKHKKI